MPSLRTVFLGAFLVAAGCRAPEVAADVTDLTMEELPIAVTRAVPGTFTQTLDHASPTSATFAQRYWMTTEFADGPESPVLYYFCGEQTCGPWALERMGDTAKTLHAAVVALEHRYYGKSKPFEGQPTTPDLQWLTIHQALEDAATFQAFARRDLGLAGKWIAVGGSYSGMLAAFYREKHPELVVGAWASSAPVDVRRSFSGMDEQTARTLGPACLSRFQGAIGAAQEASSDAERRDELARALFGVPWQKEWAVADVLGFLSFRAVSVVHDKEVPRFCQALAQHDDEPLDGLIAYLVPPLVSEDAPPRRPVQRVMTPVGLGVPGDDEEADVGLLWFYQVCTEVGFFHVKNADRSLSVFGEFGPTEEDGTRGCELTFGRQPDIERTRATYFEPLRAGRVPNILYVNGTLDTWAPLSFTDPANPPPGSTVFMLQQGGHHDELTNLEKDSPIPVFEAHVLFHRLAEEWLR
jgi:pimeloyl-ACP methyl ester carboxylesterase